MKTLINKIKKFFIKEPAYIESEVLELIKLEAYSFFPDLIDEGMQKHEAEIPYRGGFIRLEICVKVYIKDIYSSTYDDPTQEPSYEIVLIGFNVELYDQDGHEIEHDINFNLIEKSLETINYHN